MTAHSRLTASVAAIVLAASAVIAGGALHVGAAPTAPTNKYVALGDSYAAGQGGGSYANSCLQSPNGYPALLNSVKGTNLLRNANCRNATTADVTGTQLAALNDGTTVVTLTVGGNDLNVAGVAAACTAAVPVDCQSAIAAAGALLYSGALSTRLASTYAAIAAAAPNARTTVTGYPYLFDPSADPTIAAINQATAFLNRTIQGAVFQAQLLRPTVGIHYVDVSGAFLGHGLGGADPWINFSGPDAFHPTVAGYQAYAEAVRPGL
jgi:lysophospholipase L1-like esterase